MARVSSLKNNDFCDSFEIKHLASSPHFHQSNGRVERAIQTIKQIFKKCSSEQEITLTLLAYHDTPISNDLPSPAELFFNRRINTRLGLMYQPTTLDDVQKTKLMEKRSAHIIPPNTPSYDFVPYQPIWFTEDGYPEWKSGFIESKDTHPNSYWIVSEKNDRRLRRNQNDIKPRFPIIANPSPPTHSLWQKPTANPLHCVQPPSGYNIIDNGTPVIPSVQSPASNSATVMPYAHPADVSAHSASPVNTLPQLTAERIPDNSQTVSKEPLRTRYGREVKPKRDADFVYRVW